MFSLWTWRTAYSTPFLFAEVFYIFEACYHVSLKTFVLCTEQLPFSCSFLMSILFSSWMTRVADSASWDPFQPSTIFLWLCVLLGSLGLSLLGLGCFLSALPWNETSIVAEPFLDWEKQQGYFMYLVRDTSVCIIMDFFATILLVHACNFVYRFPSSCAFPIWNFI